jgi:hypothetical protein
MKVRAALPFLALAAVVALAARSANGEGASHPKPAKHAALERFKQLAGEWVGKISEGGKGGESVVVKYAVTAAGSAVVETIGPGTEHETVTVIHPDGKDLVLTHYCAIGNQPRMKADAGGEGNQVAFHFTGGSNMKPEKDGHMHDVTFTFVDADTLRTEWSYYTGGKKMGTATFVLKRKK